MKKEDLFEIIGDIDDRYIMEAENYRAVKITTGWTRYVGIAAAGIAVVGLIGLVMFAGGQRSFETASEATTARMANDAAAVAADDPVSEQGGAHQEAAAVINPNAGEEAEYFEETTACEDASSEGDVCITVNGAEYAFSDEEGFAYLQENVESIRSSLEASGVEADEMAICEDGYSHFRTDDNSVDANVMDYPVYNGDELIGIITVINDEDGMSHTVSFGADWYEHYAEFLQQHKGEKLVYLYVGATEAVITSDNRVWCVQDLQPVDIPDGRDDAYYFCDQEINTFIP